MHIPLVKTNGNEIEKNFIAVPFMGRIKILFIYGFSLKLKSTQLWLKPTYLFLDYPLTKVNGNETQAIYL